MNQRPPRELGGDAANVDVPSDAAITVKLTASQPLRIIRRMPHLLEEQIDFLGRQLDGSRATGEETASLVSELDAALALAVEMFALLRKRAEKVYPPGVWDEEGARALVPNHQRWFAIGQRLLEMVREARRLGYEPDGLDAFMRAYLECKPVATDFDSLAESQRRWLGGDRSGYRPIEEVRDELRHQGGGVGSGEMVKPPDGSLPLRP